MRVVRVVLFSLIVNCGGNALIVDSGPIDAGDGDDSKGTERPLVTFNVALSGDLAPLRPGGHVSERSLQVALVWGAQWLPEPFCLLPPESDVVAAVIAAGCRDPFGFVPARVAASTPIAAGGSATLSLFQLPTADVLVGDVTGRVAYASFVVYDDWNGSGTLELSQSHGTPAGPLIGGGVPMIDSHDIIYGASFLTMTEPDQRVAYREGAFNWTEAFYPRAGCNAPPMGFSIVGAGGFPVPAALKAALTGTLPQEDPATCSQWAPSATVVNVTARAPADINEVGCYESANGGRSRYQEPPSNSPDFTGRQTACAQLPASDTGDAGADGGPKTSSLTQLVVSGRATDQCKGLTHYTLRGCRNGVSCTVPDWDFTVNPPSWWPCPN